jgi:hypothetical protein
MLYYIQYYINTEQNYPVSHQIGNEILIKSWQQVISLKINDLIENYDNKKTDYQPMYLFLKYETNKEKIIIENLFKQNLVPISNFNIATNILQTTDNIIVIKM